MSVDSITRISDSELTVSFTVSATAATGNRDISVINVGTGAGPTAGATGFCFGCVSVT